MLAVVLFSQTVFAAAPYIVEYGSGITSGASPSGITSGPDGNVWFAENSLGRIGKITLDGTVTEYSAGISGGASPVDIALGSDGNLWFNEGSVDKIGKITPSGVVTEYDAGITAGAFPDSITAGPDGNLWFTESGTDSIGKITTSGVVTEYSAGITAGALPNDITAGPDGNLWFTEFGGKITTSGTVTEYSTGMTAGSVPTAMTRGPDGNLWFTEVGGDRIGQLVLIPTVFNMDGTKTTTVTSEYNFSTYDYTVVDKQTLILDGGLCDVTVQSGGTLMGTGQACTITVQSGGTINPGHSPGCLVSGNLSLSGMYIAELAGTTACSGYDQLQVTGTVAVGGTLSVSLLSGFTPTVGDVFTVITNDGADPVTGTFAGLAEGATFTVGAATFAISYVGGNGNDVTLTVTAIAAPAPDLPGLPTAGGNTSHTQFPILDCWWSAYYCRDMGNSSPKNS